MATTVEFELKELLEKLDSKIDKLDNKIDRVSTELNAKIDRMSGDINKLNATVTGLDAQVANAVKRIDSNEFANRAILIGLVVAILGGLAKLLGFTGPPL
jgi:outer membrane murein-binding lipoprotein Lpp